MEEKLFIHKPTFFMEETSFFKIQFILYLSFMNTVQIRIYTSLPLEFK